MPLVDHPAGDYRFLPGIAPYSCGVVARPGFEIVRCVFENPLPYRAGLEKVAGNLGSVGRSLAALCGIELRSPAPFTFEGFADLNRDYAAILESWGIFVNGVNPVARTNVAPVYGGPSEVVVHAFTYTRPTTEHTRKTFVVAGGGELPEGKLDAESIIARGDLTAEGLERKAAFVLGLMQDRLRDLGGDWSLVTAVDVYTRHSMDGIIRNVFADKLSQAWRHGLSWYVTDPPIREIEFEMDLRGVVHEILLAGA
jgi:hypothetical protein